MIRMIDVCKSFGSQKVLDHLNFEVADGQSLVIMGPSGAGKSVILKHIIGLLCPDAGRVEVDEEEVCARDRKELQRLRRSMGYLFQHSALINWLTVFENVALPLHETTAMSGQEIKQQVEKVLHLVQMEDAQDKLPSQLSGGMQKRVGLARAIVAEPKTILYDEPEAGLDPEMSASISNMMRRLKEELGMTSVTVTHSVHCAVTVADTLAVFEHGRFLIAGPPTDVLNSDHPRVRSFLGAALD